MMYAHSRTHASNFSNQMLYTCRLQLRKAALEGATCLAMEENSPEYLTEGVLLQVSIILRLVQFDHLQPVSAKIVA